MQNDKIKQTKQEKTQSIVFFTILTLIIVALIIMLFKSCDNKNDSDTPQNTVNPGIQYDDGAVEGGWTEADADKIIDSLNQKVEEGMINISMNTTPVFENGTSSGNLMIVNETTNRYPQVVEITRNDNSSVIYKSGAIPVGSKIEEAKLGNL